MIAKNKKANRTYKSVCWKLFNLRKNNTKEVWMGNDFDT